jgi:phosphonate transport system ATP-binding protein
MSPSGDAAQSACPMPSPQADRSQRAALRPQDDGAPAVEVSDVWFRYGQRDYVLRGVSLAVPAHAVTTIVGASGSGKTTLLRLIKGLDHPERGTVGVTGSVAGGRRGWRLDPRVAYIPQQLGLVRGRTVLENALTGALSRAPRWRTLAGNFPRALVEEARATLDALGVGHKSAERVRALSGGERQRVAIARALMQQPTVILADEFVSQLDPATTRETLALMRSITQRGVTLLMTTHELDVVERFADRVVLLRAGEKVLDEDVGVTSSAGLAAEMGR